MTTLSDLASLPRAAAIETLSFEDVLAQLQAEFQARYPAHNALLASDPALKLLEVAAYREVLLRNRINAAAKAALLAFATGSDLDHLAAFYGVAPAQRGRRGAALAHPRAHHWLFQRRWGGTLPLLGADGIT